MIYTKVNLTCNRENVEMLTSLLMDMGIFSVEIKDNQDVEEVLRKDKGYEYDFVNEELTSLNPDEKPVISFYFDNEMDQEGRDKIADALKAACPCEMEILEEDDETWKYSYRDHFKTLILTDDLVVVPSWEEDTFKSEDFGGRMPIFMDPGLAFGTGGHETTSMCARFMSQYGCKGKSVLDVGTGSGILAIGAYLMGATDIKGIDIDPVAVEVANENAEKNGCKDKMDLCWGDLVEGVDFKADIVVGNLVAEIVMELGKHVSKHLNQGGIFISSGILTTKKEMVIESFKEVGLTVIDSKDEGDWSAIVAKYE